MSRKIFWFVLILVLGIGVLSTGVFAQATQVDPFSTDLIVGGGNPASAMDIGDVQVWNDAESLYIRYVITDPSWCIVETHLQTATSLQDIPQRKGNPIPGQFEENDIYECVAQVLYIYNLAEKGWFLDDLLYIAAHATVMDNLGNIDTAWGAGFDFPGKNWATYFTYVVEGEIPVMWPDEGTITIAFEDLPIYEQFDYDYNDWVVDIDTLLTFWGTSTNRELQNIEFTFRPEARGAGYDHVFNMFFPAGAFGCDGVSTLRIFDGEGNLIHESIEDFVALVDNNFVVIPWTRDALPEDYVFATNTIEGMPYVDPQRTVYLDIAFNELCPFDFSGFDLTNPGNIHGEGLFFDPWLYVVDTDDEVHQSDSRMLAVPVDWLWPEELTPIWLAYPDVVPGDPPNFTELWYLNFNDLVYNAEVGGAISGQVTEQGTGLPVAEIWVDSCYETVPEEEWGTWPQCQGAFTDENGDYTIPYLRPGNHRVVIWGGEDYLYEYYEDTHSYDEATLVAVVAGSNTPDINFAMDAGGTISGTVYEADGTTPIPDVHVDACSTDDTFCNGAETGDSGEYTITGLLHDKEYRVFIGDQPGWASEIYQETIWWDQATPVSVGAAGIDFTLEPGGSISGLVTDVDGNPLANMGVDIMDGGYGACTDDDGNYTIAGLPLGTYDIVAGRDFCEPHQYVEEVIYDVEINEMTPDIEDIDFTLELGGAISGWVTDESGAPIVDIGVDACDESVSDEEWGSSPLCNGASTDENGFYTITGLVPGNYRVVIWGGESYLYEYYEETRSFYEATLVPVSATVTTEDINFTLSTPRPELSAWPNDDYVEGWEWDEGSSVTLTIDDPSNGPGVDYSDTQIVTLAEWNPDDTYVSFNFRDEFDLQPGFIIMMTDITYTKLHTVTELTIIDVNPDTEIISGSAATGSHVYAEICDDSGCTNRHEIVDPFGDWTADFSVPGNEPGEENIYNIAPGVGGDVRQMDDDGDTTRVGWWIEEPYEPHPSFLVNLTSNEVHSWEWIAGATMTLTIDAPGTEWTQVYSDTTTVMQDGSEPWETFTWFSFPDELGVGPGYRVTLTDGSTTKEHIVNYMMILEVSEENDTVSGMADAGVEIYVDSWQGAMRRTWADETGFWIVDFSVPGTEDWEQDIIDLVPGSGGGVNQYDEDGDSTNINYEVVFGGSISGNVSDANGPAAYVWVDACIWDDSYCNGTHTDENGDYTIYNLFDGNYRVHVWGGQGSWFDEFYNDQRSYEEADPVSVTLGSDTSGIDFFMDPAGSISGVVTDADGNPLANMGVDLIDGGYGTCTDENGHFTVWSLPFGTYDIVAGRDFCGPHPYVEAVIFGVETTATTPDIVGIDFSLELGGSISGNVSDANGPATYVWVDACTWDDSFCRAAQTDEDGDYTIYGLIGGDYRAHVWGGQGSWLDEFYNDRYFYEDADLVLVTVGSDIGDIDFFMDPAGSISGTVLAVGGGLIGDNIDMAACLAANTDICWGTSVQSDGTYLITGLPAGVYIVHAYQYPEGYWIGEVYDNTRDWSKYTPVSVTAGGETSSINFTLELGGAITGVVEDGGGNGIAGIWVEAYQESIDAWSWAQTDETGAYRILGLPGGDYRVYINPQAGWVGQDYAGNPVTVNPGSDTFDIDFTLASDSTISGTVTDDLGNHISEQIDVAACLAENTEICWWTTVQENDTYTVIGLPSGEFIVNVYEVGEPGGNWIGETYPTNIILEEDEDVTGIDFLLAATGG